MNLTIRSIQSTQSLLIASVLSICPLSAIAQPIEPIEPDAIHDHVHVAAERLGVPEELGQITQALREQVNASYLSDAERAQLRLEHGLWTQHDLIDPVFAGRAALDLGIYNHPDLSNPHADPLDRAQASLIVGDPELAIELLDTDHPDLPPRPIASLVVRAQAHEMLGDLPSCILSLQQVESILENTKLKDANEIAWAVEGLMLLTKLQGPQLDAKAEYQNLAKLLANARDNIDRLSWRVRLVEAKLLYAHNNYNDARNAAVETLRLHPRNAQAAALIAGMAVDSFDFDTAEEIAAKIDLIAAGEDNEPKPTLHSSFIHARIALRRKDPQAAEFALDPILAQMPTQRDALALNAASAAAGFRMSSTNRLLNKYNELSPNSPNALMQVASTLSEYRQYEYAAEMYRRIIELSPHWAKPRLQLGLLLVQAGKDQLAKDTLESALDLDPFDIRAQNSLTLVTELATYKTIETDHFIIRYKDGIDQVLAVEMPSILERIHARVASNQPGGVDHTPSQKTIIELMPNHEWFAVRIGGMPSIHTMAASTGPVIAIESPREGGPKSSIGRYDWARVLQHEYTHTVNLARTKNRVIHWMTEANAVFNEDSPRDTRTWTLLTNAYLNDELFDLVEINTAFVRPKKPTDRSLAYAQGAWMFEFIVERFGSDAPLKVFDASAAGRSAIDAFDEALGFTPESFLAEFKPWAKQQLQDQGLILPDDYPDLTELFDTNVDEGQPPEIPSLPKINELLDQYPDHPQLITLRIGIALIGTDDRLTQDQVSMLEHAITVRPTDETPHKRLAKHYLASDSRAEHTKAIPHLEYLDAREINSPAYASQLALLYAQQAHESKAQDDQAAAIDKALRAVSIAPYDADQRERAAQVALIINDLDQAKHQLESLILLEPDRQLHQRRLESLIQRIESSE